MNNSKISTNNVLARDLMSKNLIVFGINDPLVNIIEELFANKIAGCFLVDDDKRLVGYLHFRNILMSGYPLQEIFKLKANDLSQFIFKGKVLQEDADLKEAMHLLSMTYLGLVTVVNKNYFPIGVVTAKSLLYHAYQLGQEGQLVTEELQNFNAQLKDFSARNNKNIEEEFQRNKELIENAPDMIHSVNEEGYIVDVNRRECELLGYTKEELLKLKVDDIYAPEVIQNMLVGFEQLKEKKGDVTVESTLITKDRKPIPVEVNTTPVFDLEGNFLYTRSIIRDISDRKKSKALLDEYITKLRQDKNQLTEEIDEIARIKKILEDTNLELEGANQLKGDLLAMVSHDLKSPLNTIIGLSSLALEEGDEFTKDDLIRFYQSINRQGILALELCENLLDSYKIEHGAFKLNLEDAPIKTIIDKSIEEMKFLAEQKGLAIEVNNEIPGGHLLMDVLRMEQVVKNVLSNAIKWGPNGSKITVEVARSFDDEFKQEAVVIRVIDRGPGMTEEQVKNLFNKDIQLRKKNMKGTGFGLSIVKQIVDHHGGRMFVESEPNMRTCFSVILPNLIRN